MATTVKTPQQLAEERKKIIQASLAQTTMEAQQSAAQQRQALAEQTRKQSIDYNQALAAAQQSAYSRGNQIQQAYGQRGLANSGMQQYGQIQNRQALGGTVNQLASQNAEVARAAMDASRNVGQNLQNTLMRARLGADAQQMDADEQLYAREQQGQEQQFQRALQAMEAFGISPDNPQYQQIMQQLFAGQLDPSILSQLDEAVNAPVDILGDVGIKRSNVGKIGKASLWASEKVSDFFRLNKGESAKNQKSLFSYDIGGNSIKATSAKDAEQKITEFYANKPFIANGQIKVFVDATSGRAMFVDVKTGTQSSTYNKAAEKLKG